MALQKREEKEQLQVYIPVTLDRLLRKTVTKESVTLSAMVADCLERGLEKYARKPRRAAPSSK